MNLSKFFKIKSIFLMMLISFYSTGPAANPAENDSESLEEKLFNAVFYGEYHVVKALLDQGADPSMPDPSIPDTFTYTGNPYNSLYCAATNDRIHMYDLLLEHTTPEKNDWNELLMIFSHSGDWQEVQRALNNGADSDFFSRDALTPLMLAAKGGHLGVVNTLLTSGAAVNTPGYGQFTALHYAVDGGHMDIMRTLLSHGADPALKDMNGRPALPNVVRARPGAW